MKSGRVRPSHRVRLGVRRTLRATVLVGALAAPLTPGPAGAQTSALADLNLPYLHYFGFGAFKIQDQRVWSLRGRVTPSRR